MSEYIDREALLERIDGIWDCNDLVFRPNDHCCNVPEDCKGCKWAETRDAIRRIVENAPAADVRPVKWIPVTERLPEKRKYVLVRYKNNDMAVACWFDGDEDILFWRAMTDEGWCADCDTDPTHWMPLPEPPKEGT